MYRACSRSCVMFVHVTDIGLPWWMAIMALPFVAPGWVLLAAGLSLVLAMVVGRRRNLSSGHLVAVCAIATVVGAIALPVAGFFAVDGGALRAVTILFVVALGVGLLLVVSAPRAE
jgi:hypothetical protein